MKNAIATVSVASSNPIRSIQIRGARTHNLQNVDLDVPRGQFVVITGVSGSGKSSLAIDTIFAEGQRQYLESLSSYARQFVHQIDRPDVDSIQGLQPSLCIDQQQGSLSPRSTVGTVTEIYDYLRLLMARVAIPACYQCGAPIDRQSVNEIVDSVYLQKTESRLTVLAPMVIGRKGAHSEIFDRIAKAGLVRAKVDGVVYEMEEIPTLAIRKEHSISAVVDRIILKEENLDRIKESIETAVRLSNGLVEVCTVEKAADSVESSKVFSTRYSCMQCGINLIEIEPRTFSFNSQYGACPTCEGFGTLAEGTKVCTECNGARLRKETLAIKLNGLNIADVASLTLVEALDWFSKLRLNANRQIIGEPILKEIKSRIQFLCSVGLEYLTLGRSAETLSGGELQRVRLATSIGTGLTGVCYVLDEPSVGLHPRDTQALIESLRQLQRKGNSILVVEHDHEIMRACDWIIDCGPGAGREGGRIVAEGPSASFFNRQSINKYPESVTAKTLCDAIQKPTSRNRPVGKSEDYLELINITHHNVQSVSLSIPLRRLVGVSGVSGSGKSTLIQDTLVPAVAASLSGDKKSMPPHFKRINGFEKIDKLIAIDQSPIGRSPRSTPATYCGFWDQIRKLYASTRDSKQRGFTAAHFSFNAGAGRCETCSGQGRQKLEMNFLADVYVLCPQCRGTRFQRSTLAVRFKGKSIAQILEMSIAEAADFFSEIPKLKQPLDGLVSVGLGYMPIGQPATTISGGEAQRIKLASELARTNTGNTLYVLDEPTTGLHSSDVFRLIDVLQGFVERGNSVLVIEHHMDVIRCCDWIIDVGPGAGIDGGCIVSEGPPEALAKQDTPTGIALRTVLNGDW